jgi:hypothetical protein
MGDDSTQIEDADRVSVLTSTLFANGLLLENSRRVLGVLLLTYSFEDDFGCRIPYLIALADSEITPNTVESIQKVARNDNSHVVVVGEITGSIGVPFLSFDRFLARFGGPVASLLPLDPRFSEHLRTLGDNRLPLSLSGRPDDLFEEYVRAGLQFVLGRKVHRYGQTRRGEVVPDGYIPFDKSYLLYDAKASRGGYEVTVETIRQCADYVQDFGRRYDSYGLPYGFLVLSGAFLNRDGLLQRNRELYARTRVPLVFMDADALVEAVGYLSANPALRRFIDWRAILAEVVVSAQTIRKAGAAVLRDAVVGGRAP